MNHAASHDVHGSVWKQAFRRRLLAWYRGHARDLPWRRTRDPYHVWVSEVMLQQTQVATVIPYFERFVAVFPRIEDLAAAPEQQVLRLWEGLGYYRRARQLHQAARQIVTVHGGVFPRELAQVQALPGIGRYTAGAILSIAHDARHPILEANTVRLFSRLLAFRGEVTRAEGRKLLWDFAEAILPRARTGNFNQALMELGALICTPRAPQCEVCPVAALCPTRTHGWQDQIPAERSRLRYEETREACVVVWRGDRVLLRRCAEGERWAGLWDFPRFAAPRAAENGHEAQIANQVRRLTGVIAELHGRWTTIKHGVTRFRITLDCYRAEQRGGRARSPESKWLHPSELEGFPLSRTARRIARLITSP